MYIYSYLLYSILYAKKKQSVSGEKVQTFLQIDGICTLMMMVMRFLCSKAANLAAGLPD